MKKGFTLVKRFQLLFKITRHPELASFFRNLLISWKMDPLGVVSGSINNNQTDRSRVKHGMTIAFTLAEVFHPLRRSKKIAFTLAEVLITLGIIGVVAALTMPSLIAKHQKQVYYTQFRKAASQLENALQRYEFDHGCLGNLIACRDDNNIGSYIGINNFIDDFSKYFNVTQLINDDNYQEICANYDKTIIRDAYSEMGSEICKNDIGNDAPINTTAFITADGTLYTFARDDGAGGGNWIDINGPSKGPNKIGRDLFIFYLSYKEKIYWGGDNSLDWEEDCDIENNEGYGCAAKLLQEGKMNY